MCIHNFQCCQHICIVCFSVNPDIHKCMCKHNVQALMNTNEIRFLSHKQLSPTQPANHEDLPTSSAYFLYINITF